MGSENFYYKIDNDTRKIFLESNMQHPVVDSNFKTYRLKRKKRSFFTNTDARQWSFQHFYSSTISSKDAPKTFNEIVDAWTASLKYIRTARNIPKSIVNFARDLIEFNNTKEFERMRRAYAQNFEAHSLAIISRGSVRNSKLAKRYMTQANEILDDTSGKQDEEVFYTTTTNDEDPILV